MTKGSSARLRVAIYARMSTDKQSTDSPEDQIARCRDFASARGWTVADDLVVRDAGISGASRHERPQFLELMARINEWDVLLCWDFSRLARNEEDLGWVRNRLKAAKKNACAVSTGRSIHDLGSRVEGLIAAEYLEKLKADTHRGLRGRAERGLAAGGTPYGYKTVEIPSGKVDVHGRSIPSGYRIEIHEAEARVVKRVFEFYANGEGLRTIAHRLNAERVPSPRGKGWAPSALHALLQNPIYRGEYLWNRSEWIKDHESGKRRRFERPESEWLRSALPELRIVTADLWERAQEVRRAKTIAYEWRPGGGLLRTHAGAGHRVRSRHLLSGFLACAECGGSFYALSRSDTYGCGWHRDRGEDVCRNNLRVARLALEERVLGAVRERILVPDVVLYAAEQAVALVLAEIRRADPRADRARLREIDQELANLARFAAKTGQVDTAAELYGELHGERAQIAARIGDVASDFDLGVVREVVLERVTQMRAAFDGSDADRRGAFRALLGDRRMSVAPHPDRGFQVEGLFELPLEPERVAGGGDLTATRMFGSGGGI
jgi:site-specific DNA recombinase